MKDYSKTPEKVYQLLLESTGPMDLEDIQESLPVPDDYIGQALMELYEMEKADWFSAHQWAALPDEEHTIHTQYGNIKIGTCEDDSLQER